MLPTPGFGLLIALKTGQRGRDRALPPRWTQPHIDLIQPPRRQLRGQRRDHGLRQTRVILPGRQRSRPGRDVNAGRIINHQQVKIGPRIQPSGTK